MWQCSAIPESGLERRDVLPWRARDEALWCFTHTLPYWLLSSPWFTLAMFHQEAWEMNCFLTQMHAPAKTFIHRENENFSISAPGILSLKFTRKTEFFKSFLSLNTDGTRTSVLFSRILTSCFLLLPIWFALFFQVFYWFNSSSPPSSCLPPHFPVTVFLGPFFFLYPKPCFLLLLCFLFEK